MPHYISDVISIANISHPLLEAQHSDTWTKDKCSHSFTCISCCNTPTTFVYNRQYCLWREILILMVRCSDIINTRDTPL